MNDSDNLHHGLWSIQVLAYTVVLGPCPEACIKDKLAFDLHMECKKFVKYREHRIRDRQQTSVHRIRAILAMIAEVQTFGSAA